MKKLMFVAALAAAMTSFADVTSANVVGYANRTAPAGYSMHCPTFQRVDGEMLTWGDIQIVDGAMDMSEMIMILDENGQNPETFVWAGAWYNMDDEYADMTDVPLPADGRGFYVHMNDDTQFQFTGAVEKGEITKTIPAGYSILGNCTNRNLTFGDLELIDSASDMSEMIMIIDENGQNPETYVWAGAWYNMDDEYADMTEEPLPAGKGLYFHVNEPVTLSLPAQL